MLRGIHKTKGGFLTTSHIQVEGVRKARQEYQPSKAIKFKKYSLLDVNAQNLGEQLREPTPREHVRRHHVHDGPGSGEESALEFEDKLEEGQILDERRVRPVDPPLLSSFLFFP